MCIRGSSSLLFLVFAIKVLEVESELQRDEFNTGGASELRHGELIAGRCFVGSCDLAVLGNVSTFGWSSLVKLNLSCVVLAASIVGLSIEYDCLESLLGLELGNKIVLLLSFASIE